MLPKTYIYDVLCMYILQLGITLTKKSYVMSYVILYNSKFKFIDGVKWHEAHKKWKDHERITSKIVKKGLTFNISKTTYVNYSRSKK